MHEEGEKERGKIKRRREEPKKEKGKETKAQFSLSTVIFRNPPTYEELIFFSMHGVIVILQSLVEMSLPRSVTASIPRW
jgi:hypothetical protein